MPKISIITPTKDRERFLPTIWDCVRNQSIQDIEWLIHDGSAQHSAFLKGVAKKDKRVRYMHNDKPMSLGEKRNTLIREAKGRYIVHMDDDDYYAPGYIEAMLTLLTNDDADIVKLYGFFLYHERTGMYGYWDLVHPFPLHHLLDGRRDDIPMAPKSRGRNEEWGYGFSYVYDRKVWEAHPFPDQNHGEDQVFADAAIAKFNHAGMQDNDFLVVHVLHAANASVAYPQQLLPNGFGQAYFPDFTPPATPVVATAGP